MTSLVGEFDEHPSICYQPIARIFWNEFPYKVLVFESLPRPKDASWGGNQPRDKVIYDEWVAHRAERKKFYYARMRHCPDDTSMWRSMNNGGHTFSFFFKEAAHAKHFITRNRKHITKVFRPETEAQIAALAQDRKLVLKDRLFWNRYRYCVEFKEQRGKEAEVRLDERVLELFQNKKNAKRYLYSAWAKKRRLYLKNENDIFYVKLALYEHFSGQTEALLKKDISK